MGSFSPEGFRKPFLFEVGVPSNFFRGRKGSAKSKRLRNTALVVSIFSFGCLPVMNFFALALSNKDFRIILFQNQTPRNGRCNLMGSVYNIY
jgi:hypothetical protein